MIRPVPRLSRGALRDRHERWERDAVDAIDARRRRASMRTAKSCGPDTPTLVSSLSRLTSCRRRWQQARFTGESTKETVKTIAQGRPGISGEPVVTMLACFYFRTQGCGCTEAPGFPCALCLGHELSKLGHVMSRERGRMSCVIARSASDDPPSLAVRAMVGLESAEALLREGGSNPAYPPSCPRSSRASTS